MSFSPLIRQLIDSLRILPGVGQKTAQRMALQLLERDRSGGLRLAQVVKRDGKIEQREVRTGLSDRLRVQILDGLAEGEQLVIGAPSASGG